MLVQAKPYINEAHVFNDAGLSFDVWPPYTNLDQHKSTAHSEQTCDVSADLAGVHGSSDLQQHSAQNSCCTSEPSTQSYLTRKVSTVQSYSSSDKGDKCGCNSDSDLTQQVAGAVHQGAGVKGRGFLLAAKLWQEILLTVTA